MCWCGAAPHCVARAGVADCTRAFEGEEGKKATEALAKAVAESSSLRQLSLSSERDCGYSGITLVTACVCDRVCM